MSNSLTDENARKEALDVEQSFIVQAPAGSGKTELLTQRILALLEIVNKAPEQVLAITFTRKAAAEMRTRVLSALIKAKNEPEPEEAHQKATWQLAKNVLKRDQLENWNLIDQPNRLRVLTIDGLCSRIARQCPTQSKFGGSPVIAEDPTPFYRAAAQSLLLSFSCENAWSESLKKLLLHVDNHVGWLETLFVRMLSKRDQWLPYVLSHERFRGDPESYFDSSPLVEKSGMTSHIRFHLENTLQKIIKETLTHCTNTLPDALMTELIILCNFSAKNLNLEHQFDSIPEDTLEDLSAWQFIASILLRADGLWRKQMTKTTGFPAPSSEKEKVDKDFLKDMKNRMHALLVTLCDYEPFRLALDETRNLPPANYSEQQWEMVSALIDVLPVLVAYLKVEFQTNNNVDYIEVSSGALNALGSDDSPTDLALNWDYKIEHILVDEFQDTALTQFRLLEKLIQGWEPDDGRTLFVVGDPMQSIYRFREAEVGLFLRARHLGIGHMPLKYLQLQMNFRSEKNIVDWINQCFSKVFPMREDIALGAVPYSESLSPLTSRTRYGITTDLSLKGRADGGCNQNLLLNANDQQEAQAIINLIKQKQAENPTETIAILVRSRTHLEEIIPLLQQSNIRFQANDIEGLSHRMVIRDLVSLTKALYHLGDRLAWLSILRAPWCGLTLKDLHLIAADQEAIIYNRLTQYHTFSGLSNDAKERIQLFLSAISEALERVKRTPLHECVKSTWYALNGPACVEDKSDLDNAERFFELLEKVEQSGDLQKISELERRLTSLFAAPDPLADGKLQLMSIHKAKGLEFDHVIVPGMNKRAGNQTSDLLTWLERPNESGQSDLILAPIKHAAEDYDPIYQYCSRIDAQKSELELLRLLYVAVTRAKKSLYLFGTLETDDEGELLPPKKKSFLEYLWPVLEEEIEAQLPPDGDPGSMFKPPMRLTLSGMTGVAFRREASISSDSRFRPPSRGYAGQAGKDAIAPIIGTLIHEILFQITQIGLENYPLEKIPEQKVFWKARLYELGLLEEQHDVALNKIDLAITNTLTDERGRWILSDQHEAKSEYPISTVINDKVTHIVIDRTFVDESDIRWIIDYKTGEFNEAIYGPQLKKYAKATSYLEERETKLCLYFPLNSKMFIIQDEKVINYE